MPRVSYAKFLRGWEGLIEKVLANQDDLPHLDAYRTQLETELAGAKEANSRQVSHQAAATQATRDLEGFLERGNDLMVRLNDGIRSVYGNRGEKLKEFGLQPRRPRQKKAQPTVTTNGTKKGPATGEEEEKAAPSKATTDAEPQ